MALVRQQKKKWSWLEDGNTLIKNINESLLKIYRVQKTVVRKSVKKLVKSFAILFRDIDVYHSSYSEVMFQIECQARLSC